MKFEGASRFPTRNFPYHRNASGLSRDGLADPLKDIPTGAAARFILGIDRKASVLDPRAEASPVNDAFAKLVLAPGHRPETLLELLAVLDAVVGPDALPDQRIYRVADGGQIAWDPSTADLDRHLRLVVTRHREQDAEIFVSTAPPFNSSGIFLQVFAWDPVAGAYNFYERRSGTWSWAGNSWHSLRAPTRGRGPFDSHVNGGPVMKELKVPWLHWHSQASPIQDEIFAPDDPLRSDTLYHSSQVKGAEDLELIVRSGTSRWTKSRFDREAQNGILSNAQSFLRQVVTTTTVNLTSSPQQSASLAPDELLRLPTTFFLNTECLVDELNIPANIQRLKVPGAFYTNCLSRYAVQRQDGGVVVQGDVDFAFAVPEPSLEDRVILAGLLGRGVLSRRLAACLLMVDFQNPIFSRKREYLLRFFPTQMKLDGSGEALFVQAVRDPGGEMGAEFLSLWDVDPSGWEQSFATMIETHWTKLTEKLGTADGFDEIFRLAESRRRQFRKRPLSEFGLTLPIASTLAITDFLRMDVDAHVLPDPEEA
ncbi:hypothetical protein FHS26_005407 [Rhizobium pisi]|uniref:Uncharacterized protein n=1 Tax=Rhizobium pisi TaxID=574561 RepID=A0A7W5G271_9HYPH|nr:MULTISPECIES: hypothetical protein [Rhizobium]MBB3137642.1 hypothetical protein [Rhizobium pisi]MBY5494560.1 hypothetical protein [Rhizobium leguminosarum]TCA31740.1 hypothetical protein E0H72_34020 [Rhizobium leguminosarum bv. viciae]TCA49264.1 hypothetical protein E0H71_27245 [Rhizobium leguminosarum bv. viciae]